ncbi:hypothetical protein ERO13_D10G142850v2 [Gossypium hirsutum]|uniref:Uncharacterized protein n=1 Tax=Gossypium darwinii TaxID=34276 RepID=A0A5D2B2P4_GOSDA|nr:hypothetical protein ERO13_D10G142850v2 [Gossypium hirsutum]TYG50353.1 hypothetical protein ES288_D10G168700v1 [Gossypium darwinii]
MVLLVGFGRGELLLFWFLIGFEYDWWLIFSSLGFRCRGS